MLFALLGLFVIAAIALLITQSKVAPGPEQALLITSAKGTEVHFEPQTVLPVIHKAELMTLAATEFELVRAGKDGVLLKDGTRLDVGARFSLRVKKQETAILEVAQQLGVERAGDSQTLLERFSASFLEAFNALLAGMTLEEALALESRAAEALRSHISEALGGYQLVSIAVERWAQTPLECLDPSNLLEARGVKKLTELEAKKRIEQAQLEKKALIAAAGQEREALEAIAQIEHETEKKRAEQLAEIERVRAEQAAAVASAEREVERARLSALEAALLETEAEAKKGEE